MKHLFLAVWLLASVSSFAGTVDGGGGGLPPKFPAYATEVEEVVLKAKKYLYITFNRLAIIDHLNRHNTTGMMGKVFEQLFNRADKYTVYRALDEVKFVSNRTGGCLDLLGVENDASAFNADPLEICVSIKRIAPKLESNNYFVPTVALMAHEMGHRMGLDEAHCIFIQSFVQSQLDQNFHWSADYARQDYEDELRALLRAVGEAKYAMTNPNTHLMQCMYVGSLSKDLEKMFYRTNDFHSANGVSFGKAMDFFDLLAAGLKSKFATYYCLDDNHPEKVKAQTDYFKGQDRMLLNDFGMIAGGIQIDYGSQMISYVKFQDPQYVNVELDEIETIINQLIANSVMPY